MNKAKVLGFIGSVASAAFFTYVWFQIGRNYERNYEAEQKRIKEQSIIKVALSVKPPDRGVQFSEVCIPIDGQVIVPTDIGNLTFKHESLK